MNCGQSVSNLKSPSLLKLPLINDCNSYTSKLANPMKLSWPRGTSTYEAGVSVMWPNGEEQITRIRKVLTNPEGFCSQKDNSVCQNLASFELIVIYKAFNPMLWE